MSYTVYFDAEFQTFRVPKGTEGTEGLVETPPFLYHAGNEKFSIYHFLLSIGLIVVGPSDKYTLYLATFPSLFSKGDLVFGDGQLLEPGYTTCSPATAKKLIDLKEGGLKQLSLFPYYSSLDAEQKKVFESMNQAYNSSISLKDRSAAKTLLEFIANELIPNGIFVHKGSNDLYALHNTFMKYKIKPVEAKNIDIDSYKKIYLGYNGITNMKLTTLKNFFVSAAKLNLTEESMLKGIRQFIINRYGEDAADTLAAHNPLVDSLYAMLILIALKKLHPGVVG